jgi:hypothetical protein
LMNLLIDPETLEVLEITEVPYKDIIETTNEGQGESLKD